MQVRALKTKLQLAVGATAILVDVKSVDGFQGTQ